MHVTLCMLLHLCYFLLLCTLLPVVTLMNCAFPSSVYLCVLCNCHWSFLLSGQSTEHCGLRKSASKITDGHATKEPRLAYCNCLDTSGYVTAGNSRLVSGYLCFVAKNDNQLQSTNNVTISVSIEDYIHHCT